MIHRFAPLHLFLGSFVCWFTFKVCTLSQNSVPDVWYILHDDGTDQGVSFYDLIGNSGNNNNENNIYVRVIERAHQKTGRTRQGS